MLPKPKRDFSNRRKYHDYNFDSSISYISDNCYSKKINISAVSCQEKRDQSNACWEENKNIINVVVYYDQNRCYLENIEEQVLKLVKNQSLFDKFLKIVSFNSSNNCSDSSNVQKNEIDSKNRNKKYPINNIINAPNKKKDATKQ
jgi:hypothetical protein